MDRLGSASRSYAWNDPRTQQFYSLVQVFKRKHEHTRSQQLNKQMEVTSQVSISG